VATTKEITRLEKSSVCLSLTVPKDDVRLQYQDMLNDLVKKVQIPGFRKGKAPLQVLERKFGESLKGDALSRIIESALLEVFKEGNLNRNEKPLPYSTPRLEGEPKLDFDQDLQFSVVYDVLPEVKVGQWKGLEAEAPQCEIDDDDINRELEEIRERNAVVMDRDDNAAACKGDVVTVDYCVLDENGEEMQDFGRKDFVFTIGSGNNLYQFDDEITGMKKGETREFEKNFPEDFFEPGLAGKKRKMRISLTGLKEKKLPELDDELAQDVDEKFNTLNDLKNSIRERLNNILQTRLKDLKITALLQKIMENTPVTLPESMVRVEIEGRWRRFARFYNMSIEGIMRLMTSSGKTIEEIENEWRVSAEKALHSRLIVETLIEEQNFEVTEAEIEKELERMADENGESLEDVKKRYKEDQMEEFLKEDIKERRLFDILLAENTLKPGEMKKYLDLLEDNG
jgi:trigger factor